MNVAALIATKRWVPSDKGPGQVFLDAYLSADLLEEDEQLKWP